MNGTLSTPGTSQMPWEPDTSLLDAAREIAPIIRAHSEEAERERRLSQPALKALRDTGLLRMTTPRSLGGLETDPVTRALVGEEIGRQDSAAAWTLENPLDWAFFCCRLPDEGTEEIYSGGADILIAAQFGRPLKATSANGGYRISGRAPFVSNCYDADWISSTVLVDEDESAGGEPEMRMVYFRSEECEIIDTWYVMGMRGTGSNDISVTDVYVPRSRTFPMVPDFEPGSHYRGPLYRLPVVGAAASGIPTPMLGVARRALDEVTELARTKTPVASSGLLKERASAQVQLGRAEAILRSGRLLLLDTLSEAWRRFLADFAHHNAAAEHPRVKVHVREVLGAQGHLPIPSAYRATFAQGLSLRSDSTFSNVSWFGYALRPVPGHPTRRRPSNPRPRCRPQISAAADREIC
jgi:indole-3-acetate monooxygenase